MQKARMEESGRVDLQPDEAAHMALTRVTHVPVLVAGTLLTVYVQPNFVLNLFSGHFQMLTAQLLTILFSREPLSKMAAGLAVAFGSFVAGFMSMGMLIGMLAFSSGK